MGFLYSFISFIVLLLFIRLIGKLINFSTPKGGINKSFFIDVNGVKQWISIYGNDINNPVLLYLHGGPGSATSHIDYAFTRKWADIYTVVTWDQRGCGKSFDKDNIVELTKELLISDALEVTKYVLDYLKKDKLTILGHSWGTIYGANLVLEHPEYYDCFIGAGQLVDALENEKEFVKVANNWAKDKEEVLELIKKLTPDNPTMEHYQIKNQIMEQCGYSMSDNKPDYNTFFTMFFNPYYTIFDLFKRNSIDLSPFKTFISSDEFYSFSLSGKYDYKVSYYNINGDKDYQTNFELAQKYFDKVKAPKKEMFIMKNMNHGLLEYESEEFSKIVHEIYERERKKK